MNLLQILRLACHIVTNEERRRPQTSLLSAGREGEGQDGFGLNRNLVERRRFIYPPARRLLGVGPVTLSAMKLSSISLPSIRWMSWRNWICAKRQANVASLAHENDWRNYLLFSNLRLLPASANDRNNTVTMLYAAICPPAGNLSSL